MKSGNRSLWAFVAVVLVVMVLCAGAITAVGLGALSGIGIDLRTIGVAGEDRIEESFEVGAAPTLGIDNSSGDVTVHAGEAGRIEVLAIKRGTRARRDQIEVVLTPQENGLQVTTRREPSVWGGGSVEIWVTVPGDTRLALHTGSGSVEVVGPAGLADVSTGSGQITIRDVAGELTAKTGSGGIEVQGGGGPVSLETGSGGIDYEGAPRGDCTFSTGSGGIELTLPADVSVEVDLSTGSGSIDSEFQVAGQVDRRKVRGTIGTGKQGYIVAHTGSGSINLERE